MNEKWLYALVFLLLIPILKKIDEKERKKRNTTTPGYDTSEYKLVTIIKYVLLAGFIIVLIYLFTVIFFGEK